MLTAAQIEIVRDIAAEPSLAFVTTLCARLTTEQEAAMLEDITKWLAARDKYAHISGAKFGVDINPEDRRTAIRHRVRLRLGLSPVTIVDLPPGQGISLVNLRGADWFR